LKLSKDANSAEDSYFLSAYKTSISNKKEYIYPEEIIDVCFFSYYKNKIKIIIENDENL